jgi:hypothetical protein
MQRTSNNIKPKWARTVLLAVLLFTVPCVATYFVALRPRALETNIPRANTPVGLRDAAAVAVSTTSATSSAHSDVVTVENLPVDSEQAQPASGKTPKRVVTRSAEKSFDELVNESARAAARKGGIAEDAPKTVAAPSASAASEPEPAPSPEPEAPPPGIDREAAMTSLRTQAQLTRACRSLGPPPAPEGQASVTFALSGRVKSVNVSAPFAGTSLGICIQSTFKDAHAPPFKGDPTTLTVPFQIPE